MSFFFEGNAYLDASYIVNSTTSNNIITTSVITGSTIDMLSTSGNFQNITNAATPIRANDVVIKSYVDALGIVTADYTLVGTTGTLISSNNSGSFVVTVTNLVLGGPSAVFNITNNGSTNCGQVMRTVAAPGSDKCVLDISWPKNTGPILFKSTANYDGSYRVKIM
jgi:uncharacterized protein (DUF39 family)